MSNNCLVTKMKSVVNNSSLQELGVLKLNVNAVGSIANIQQQQLVINNHGCTVSIEGNGYLTDDVSAIGTTTQKSIVIDNTLGNKTIYFTNGTYTIKISNKYNIMTLSQPGYNLSNKHIISGNIDDLKYCTNLQIFNIVLSNWHGNLSSIKNLSNLKTFAASETLISGSFEDLSSLTSLTRLELAATNIVGDTANISNLTDLTILEIQTPVHGFAGKLEDFGSMTKLNELRASYNLDFGGEICQFVKRQVTATSNPRATCTDLSVPHIGTRTAVTFCGETAPSTSPLSLSWTPNATAGRTDVTLGSTTVTIDNTTGEVVS